MKYNLYKMVRKGEYERIKYFIEEGLITKEDIESYDYKVIKQALIYDNVPLAKLFIDYLLVNGAVKLGIVFSVAIDDKTVEAIGKNSSMSSIAFIGGNSNSVFLELACIGAAKQGSIKVIKNLTSVYSKDLLKSVVSTKLLVAACNGEHYRAIRLIVEEFGADVQFKNIRFRGNVMNRLYANEKIRKILESYGTDFSKKAV